MKSTPPSGAPHRVTLRDVAREAGVSTGTVSMALGRDPRVAAATRAHVLATAARLAYVYDRAAARLRGRHGGLVGFAINDLANPFHARVAAGLENRLVAAGKVLVLGNADEDAKRQLAFLATLREHRVEGIALTPAIGMARGALRGVRDWGLPLVLVTRDVPGSGVDFAGHADRRAFAAMARHLVGLGHRRIAFVGGDPRTTTARERVAGYADALAEAGIDAAGRRWIPGPATRETGCAAIGELLAKRRPTAVMAFNDPVAFGVMLGLRERGLEPGVDCAVTGADNAPEGALWRPALATVAFDAGALGAAAALLLLARIDAPGGRARRRLLDAPLVLRASASPPLRRGAAGR
jgi:LacI family transcriptional regulator